ncbi:MAG: Trk system potassium transporter TrkA [Bacteroidales bacterium]|nr:Trk system potassium transporter TrkA [Bacteroidales bacterium]
MKIVIAGAGEVGSHLARMLNEEYHDLTIIDENEENLAHISESMDVLIVQGSPTSISVLTEAGVENADLFVAVSPAKDQNVNIISALLAKKMGAKKVTARINDDEYLDYHNKFLFKELGIDMLFYPEKNAADEIIDLLQKSEMSDFVGFANGRLQLVVIKLEEGAPLIGKCSADFDYPADDLPFRTVAISRGDETIIPQHETIFKVNDLVYVVSRKEAVDEVMSYSGKEEIEIRRITILGGGKIGEMLATKLESSVDFIKIIEIDKERCEVLSERLNKTLVINGDGRNSDFLYEEDVKSCDAFIAVTSSSETNILSCVAAKRMGVAKTIAEVENIEYIRLAEEIGVDSVINKKLLAASRIFRVTLSNHIRTIKCLSGSDAEAIEYVVHAGSLITTAPIKDLNFPKDAIIGGVIRGQETFIAVGTTHIKPHDRVVVFALPSALSKLEKFFA